MSESVSNNMDNENNINNNDDDMIINIYNEHCDNKVLIIVTGGTFIMGPTKNGLEVQPGYLQKRMKQDLDFQHSSLPNWEMIEWKNPIDSSCINTKHWIKLANDIKLNYDKYSGFIVLHGTDTMAYTASALSFMLENLAKPVVITGAQIPIGEVFNDAKNNLIASLCVAGQIEICEVCLMFNNKLFRGNRATKVDAWHQNAFASPNFPALGIFGIDLEMEEKLFWPAPKKRFKIHTKLYDNIITIWLYPGFNSDLIKPLFGNNIKDIAIVLSWIGAGIGTQSNKLFKLLYTIQQNININIEIILMQQTQKGHVTNLKLTKNEHFLKLKNVINAQDMTTESVVTKCAYLMGKGFRGKQLKINFEKSIRGEITQIGSNNKIIKIKSNVSL